MNPISMTEHTLDDICVERVFGDRLTTFGFIPDLRGFDLQLARVYNHMLQKTTSVWTPTVSFEDFKKMCYFGLRCYAHLSLNSKYREYGYTTASPAAIKVQANLVQVPHYVRDMYRELCRPMKSESLVLIPYIPIDVPGVGSVPGFGLLPRCFRAVVGSLEARNMDLVPLEPESVGDAPISVCTDRYVTFIGGPTIAVHRLESVRILRHLQKDCEFYIRYNGAAGPFCEDKPATYVRFEENDFVPEVLAPVGDTPDSLLNLTVGHSVSIADMDRILQTAVPTAEVRDTSTWLRSQVESGVIPAVGAQVLKGIREFTDESANRIMNSKTFNGLLTRAYTFCIEREVGMEIPTRFPVSSSLSKTPPRSSQAGTNRSEKSKRRRNPFPVIAPVSQSNQRPSDGTRLTE